MSIIYFVSEEDYIKKSFFKKVLFKKRRNGKILLIEKVKFLDEIIEKYNQRLGKLGFTSEEEKFFKIAWFFIPFIMFFVSIFVDYKSFFRAFSFLVFCGLFQKMNIEIQKVKNNNGDWFTISINNKVICDCHHQPILYYQDEVQKLTDDYCNKMDESFEKKKKDIMDF